jgi:hypothetical protein
VSARIERYEEEKPENGEAVIRGLPYTGGPHLSNLVPDRLLSRVKESFPNVVPNVEPGEDPVLTLGRAQGAQAVVRFLEHLHNEQQE